MAHLFTAYFAHGHTPFIIRIFSGAETGTTDQLLVNFCVHKAPCVQKF